MVVIDGVKYACERCIRGHRVTTCTHTDQPLVMIKPKGRPATQCHHCREARKNKNHHAACVCSTKKKKAPKEKDKDKNFGLDTPGNLTSGNGGKVGKHGHNCSCHDDGDCVCSSRIKKTPPGNDSVSGNSLKLQEGAKAIDIARNDSSLSQGARLTPSEDEKLSFGFPPDRRLSGRNNELHNSLIHPSYSAVDVPGLYDSRDTESMTSSFAKSSYSSLFAPLKPGKSTTALNKMGHVYPPLHTHSYITNKDNSFNPESSKATQQEDYMRGRLARARNLEGVVPAPRSSSAHIPVEQSSSGTSSDVNQSLYAPHSVSQSYDNKWWQNGNSRLERNSSSSSVGTDKLHEPRIRQIGMDPLANARPITPNTRSNVGEVRISVDVDPFVDSDDFFGRQRNSMLDGPEVQASNLPNTSVLNNAASMSTPSSLDYFPERPTSSNNVDLRHHRRPGHSRSDTDDFLHRQAIDAGEPLASPVGINIGFGFDDEASNDATLFWKGSGEMNGSSNQFANMDTVVSGDNVNLNEVNPMDTAFENNQRLARLPLSQRESEMNSSAVVSGQESVQGDKQTYAQPPTDFNLNLNMNELGTGMFPSESFVSDGTDLATASSVSSSFLDMTSLRDDSSLDWNGLSVGGGTTISGTRPRDERSNATFF